MSFNKNACKRMSTIAGIHRENKYATDIINELAIKYIKVLCNNLLHVILYANKSTIGISDVQFVSQLLNNIGIICPTGLEKAVRIRTRQNELQGILKKGIYYNMYTLKKPFNQLLYNIFKDLTDQEIRIGKNVRALLQTMTEYYIITIMNRAGIFIMQNRDTLLPKDILLAKHLV